MLSHIPPLAGNWPLTTTLCLRLFNLLTESDEAPSAVDAAKSLMCLPRLSVSNDQTRDEVLHHMRFSIEYLRRLRVLSETGQTTVLFGVISHLYYEEPGNLAFAELIREGVIHTLCSKFRSNQKETEKNIVHLVATLFARRSLPNFAKSPEVLEGLRKSSPSMIVLPPLPEYILRVLDRHNEQTLHIFSAYAITYAVKHLVAVSDDVLPLSGHKIGQEVDLARGLVGKALEENCVKDCVARSVSDAHLNLLLRLKNSMFSPPTIQLFVANSGKDDVFQSIPELCRSARAGLHLNAHNVPSFGYAEPTNAYALDFWQHETVRPLVEANGFRQSRIWFELQNFTMILSTLLEGLRAILVDQAAAKQKGANAGTPEDQTKARDDILDHLPDWEDKVEDGNGDKDKDKNRAERQKDKGKGKDEYWDEDESEADEEESEEGGRNEGGDKDESEDEDEDNEQDDLLELLRISSRPVGVPEEDWVVYEAFQSVTKKFHEKWHKICA